jgi:hypothetical protein
MMTERFAFLRPMNTTSYPAADPACQHDQCAQDQCQNVDASATATRPSPGLRTELISARGYAGMA